MRIHSLAIVILAVALSGRPAVAHDITKGDLVVSTPWSRATPAGAAVGAGYLAITNKGAFPDRLVAFQTDLAGQPEIHEMSNEGGVMKMRPLTKGLVIPAGGTVKLEPGGLHLMLLGLRRPLSAGQRFKATLVFEKAGAVEIEFEVRAMGEGVKKGHGHH